MNYVGKVWFWIYDVTYVIKFIFTIYFYYIF